ncbi:hypothetical protein LINPERHAP1_LOCUS39163 [Linum perenne]
MAMRLIDMPQGSIQGNAPQVTTVILQGCYRNAMELELDFNSCVLATDICMLHPSLVSTALLILIHREARAFTT